MTGILKTPIGSGTLRLFLELAELGKFYNPNLLGNCAFYYGDKLIAETDMNARTQRGLGKASPSHDGDGS